MKDIEQPSPSAQKQSVAAIHEVPALDEVPAAVVISSEVPSGDSAYSEALGMEISTEVPSQARTNPQPSVRPAPVMIPEVKQPEVAACKEATVPIPAPSVPQPVPTRTFAKAISALQTQLLSRPRTSTVSSKEDKVKHDKGTVCPWAVGDKVVARWPDGVWRQAVVTKLEKGGKVNVFSDGLEEVMVDLVNVRPHSLPVEALNLIDQGLVKSSGVRQKGDGA